MKSISEMTAAEKIGHIRRLKKAGVPLDHIEDLMQVSKQDLALILSRNSTFMTSQDLAEKLIFK